MSAARAGRQRTRDPTERHRRARGERACDERGGGKAWTAEGKSEEKPAVPSDPSRLQQDAKPISEAELVGRLDSVPVFTLVQPDPKDNGVVIARLDDGRPFFFMDANIKPAGAKCQPHLRNLFTKI